MAEKVTLMKLKVDLECSSCYKKIKKILCKFPQIRDQVYDKKQNLVKITVVSCCPEKIRDKLCCKGGKIIKSIEIVEPPPSKPKEPEKKPKEPEKPKVVVVDKPKEPEKKPKEPEKKPKEPEKPKVVLVDKPKEPEKPPPQKPKEAPKPPEPALPPPPARPEPCWPYPPGVPLGYCCGPCWEGYGWGQCHCGYGRPIPPPPPCYDSYYGYGRKPCYVSRCDYFSEENAGGCTIM